MAIKAIINNTEKEIEQIKNSNGQDIDYVYSRIGDTEVEGELPISIKSVGGELANYRIYGNTVGGESVGDKTENLFDGELTDGYHLSDTTGLPVIFMRRFATLQPITINQSEYCLTYNSTTDLRFMYSVFNNDTLIRRVAIVNNRYLQSGDAIDTTGGNKIYFAFYNNDYSHASTGMISNIMLNEGSTAIPYEPYGYKVPVTVSNGTDALTTPIYLPEPIKMVGDEAEYIDYAEQKMHRIGADDINVTLPALSTIKGTNTISVNTSIQPSNIYIKDNFDYKRVFTAIRAIEGIPPLTYKAVEGALNNYRIYGNTVDGESVGDRTANLFDENGVVTKIFIEGDGTMAVGDNGDKFIYNRINVLPNITYTFSWQQMILGTGNNTPYIRISSYDANNNFLARDLIQVDVYPNKTCSITTRNNAAFWDIRIDDASSKRGQHLEEVMLNAGSTSLPYEPYGYKVPVTISNGTDTLTTPIYLPEQIRKVGDEAEYIDCGEQKQHVDADEEIEKEATTYMVSITPKTDVSKIVCVTMSSVPDDCTILTSGLIFTLDEADANTLNSTNYADGVRGKASTDHNYKYTWTKKYTEGETYYIRSYVKYQTADNEIKEDYGDVYKADINGFERVRKNLLPNTATSQTINTGLDGTLPALPTLPGTNVLSVGTAVQPSKVYIKGKIKEITTTYIQSIKSDNTNNKITFVVRAYLSKNDRMVRTGLVATNDPAIGVNINVNSTVITSGCNVFVKELAGVTPTTKKTEYTWTKTKVTDGEIWYVRSYVEYINSDNEQLIIYSDAAKASLDGII